MKYGDTVVLVIGGTAQNALVLQSNQVGEEEHLVVAYLDPKHTDSPVMGGQQIRGAVLFQYGVAPAKDGQHIGYLAPIEPPDDVDEQAFHGEQTFTADDAASLAQISGSGGLAGSAAPEVIVNPSPSDVDKAVQAQEQAEGSTQQADASQNTPGA